MNHKQILICGHRSFVATGLCTKLDANQLSYDCFSRGNTLQKENHITGNVLEIQNNPLLGEYDTVINFIILKNKSIEENIQYIQSLLDFCKKRNVKHLIQISSISVYPNEAEYIDETSLIEQDYQNKGGYASIKVAVDHYLINNKPKDLFVSFVRPGFVYTKKQEISNAGLFISKLGLKILFGDKKTTLPLINREKLHDAIIKIINAEEKQNVYLILDKNREDNTKYNFVSRQWNINPICLNRSFFLSIAKIGKTIHLLKPKYYQKVVGLFKRTWFNSTQTELNLDMSFGRKTFAVLGAGTYGSYTANLLSEVYPHEKIFLFDVGNEYLKTESEIGYLSHIVNAPYKGLQKSRFFGYGGASVKWGGQLLTFSDNDFANPSPFLQDIVNLNQKYKDIVLAKFQLENKIPEQRINANLFTKTGIWLSYFHRNLFKHFGIIKNRKIHLIPNSRITKILSKEKSITGIEFLQDGQLKTAQYDQYFLTCGAFESSRILINSGLSENKNLLPFSDHLSQRAFKIKSGTKMGNIDFRFLVKGASLITKRFTGEVDGYSFYSQPICNEDFPFFRDLKKLLFGHKLRSSLIFNIIKNIPQCIAFVWYMIVLKQMYVYKNEFYLQIDIEAPIESGKLILNNQIDKFGEKGLDIDLSILPQTGELFTKARAIIKEYLDKNGVVYEELPFSTSAEKYEDVYHPFGMFCNFNSVEHYFTHFDNMIVANTGILPRAGGINSTCAVFPLIEEYINIKMQ